MFGGAALALFGCMAFPMLMLATTGTWTHVQWESRDFSARGRAWPTTDATSRADEDDDDVPAAEFVRMR